MGARLQKVDFSNGKKLFKTITGLQVVVGSADELVTILRTDSEKFGNMNYDNNLHYMQQLSNALLFSKQLYIRDDNAENFVASLIKHNLVREYMMN